MSQRDTGQRTLRALRQGGLRVAPLPRISDVDSFEDASLVAATVPCSRFAAAVAAAQRDGEPAQRDGEPAR
jgi:glycosyltransferase A (GT-A) superfamily protein (DUF2064 family)